MAGLSDLDARIQAMQDEVTAMQSGTTAQPVASKRIFITPRDDNADPTTPQGTPQGVEGGDASAPPGPTQNTSQPTPVRVGEQIIGYVNHVAEGVTQLAQTPGAIMQQNPYPVGSEKHIDFENERQDRIAQFGPQMGLSMVGAGAAAPEAGALGAAGGGLRNKFTGAFKGADAGTDLPKNQMYTNKARAEAIAQESANAKQPGFPDQTTQIDPALVESNLARIENPMSVQATTHTDAPSRIAANLSKLPTVGFPAAAGIGIAQAQPNPDALPEPTAIDHTPEALAQKMEQVRQSLKDDGVSHLPPDMTRPEQWTNTDSGNALQATKDIFAGFNYQLAKTLSVPEATVHQALALAGIDYLHGHTPTQMTIDSWNRMGIPTYEVDNLASKMGKGALQAMTTFAAMQMAAPAMALNKGVGAMSYLARSMGEFALKHPVMGFMLGQTASAGGEVAKDFTGSDSPLVQFGGELAGAGAPGATKFIASKVPGVGLAAKGVKAGVNTIGDVLSDNLPTPVGNAIKKWNPFYQAKTPVPGTALVNPSLNANEIQNFSKDQVYGAQTYQDKAVENAINSIPQTGTPAQVQTRTHTLLQDAERISKRIVSTFWQKTPQKTQVNVGDLRDDMVAMKSELKDLDNQRPDVMLDKIISETENRINPATGRINQTKMTVAKLRDYQSQIGTAITEERARDAPREGVIRNLARMSDAIGKNLADALPNNTAIEQARQMSLRHNDLFSRGPINDILSKRRTGDFRTPQGDSIDSLMSKTNGLQALRNVVEGVGTMPKAPTSLFQPKALRSTSPFAATADEQNTLTQLQSSAENSIRSMWREAASQSPEAAVKFGAINNEEMKALGNVAGELSMAGQKITSAMAEKDAIRASALAKFAETSPDAAVKNLFAQRDPAAVAGQLMLRFRGDPDALEGLRNQVLNEFIYARAKTNPNLMLKMLDEPKTSNLLQQVLDPDQYQRLHRMTKAAVDIGLSDANGLRAFFASPLKTAGSIVGAKLGRMLDTGTIQVPGIFAKRMGNAMQRLTAEVDPQNMLTKAVLDPEWEALLYSKAPTTLPGMRNLKKTYMRIYSGLDVSGKQALKRLYNEGNDDNDE